MPNEHGAWAMIITPWLTGLTLSHWTLAQGWLLLASLSGLGAYHTLTVYVRSRNPQPIKQPLGTYTTITILGLLAAAITQPALIWWTPIALLLVVPIQQALIKKDRDLPARTLITLTAVMLLPITYDLGWQTPRPQNPNLPQLLAPGLNPNQPNIGWALNPQGIPNPTPLWHHPTQGGWKYIWILTIIYALYFIGTTPYVKSLIRGRRNPAWRTTTTGYHLGAGVIIIGTITSGWASLTMIPLWTIIILRAITIPQLNQKRINQKKKPIRPAPIGILEIILTIGIYLGATL
ncbi:hypothetical protein BK816_00550 [Boudabousia tangfeifanii]|uniref:YwiC-like protein n=1 Tax=Boudabousia tangfeifanii TaxID=1912795 RepID=A0A1D9MI60_9ACTO|nr:hypothetical protein BK816_00550 [Boudabousia tangfeifanii]